MNKLYEAYALSQTAYLVDAKSCLEEYICEQLNLPNGYLQKRYDAISSKASREAKGDYKTFLDIVYEEYMKLFKELEKK